MPSKKQKTAECTLILNIQVTEVFKMIGDESTYREQIDELIKRDLEEIKELPFVDDAQVISAKRFIKDE